MTVENLQFAYELARRNLKERADKQAVANETLSFPSFKPGEQILIHRPYTEADGPNPKLIGPWRGPYTVRAQTSLVIYRVTKDGNAAGITVHLGRMKKYYVPLSSPAPDLDALDDLFLLFFHSLLVQLRTMSTCPSGQGYGFETHCDFTRRWVDSLCALRRLASVANFFLQLQGRGTHGQTSPQTETCRFLVCGDV